MQDDTVRVEETRPYRGCHGGSQRPEARDHRQDASGQMPEARHDEVRVEETRPYRGCHGGSQMPDARDHRQEASINRYTPTDLLEVAKSIPNNTNTCRNEQARW